MNIQLTLARRYLVGRKLRTLLTTLAILFGVLVIVGMNSLLPAFTRAFQANVLAAADKVDATITLKTSDAFDAAVAERVAAVEGVRVVSGLLNRTVNLPADYLDNDPTRPDPAAALSLVGVNVAQATALHAYNVIDGRFQMCIRDRCTNCLLTKLLTCFIFIAEIENGLLVLDNR